MAGSSADNPNEGSEDEFDHPPPRTPNDQAAPNPSRASSNSPNTIAPSITLICTKDYSTVSKIADRDHLDDDNWYEWKERFR
jgi:hypothetical protein